MVRGIVLYDDDARVVAEVQKTMGNKVDGGYHDLDEMLDKESFAVGIADFQNHHNGSLCLRLINSGVHVISEKPISDSTAELSRIVDAAARSDVKLGVMYQNRYHPVSREARRLVKEGIVGRITGCEARMITSQVRFRNPRHWLFDKRKAGGGILSWLGCHYIDLLRYVLDDDVVEVCAIADTLSGEDIDVEDVASLAFRFRGGAIGSLHAGYQLAVSIPGYSGATYDNYVGFRGHRRKGVLESSRQTACIARRGARHRAGRPPRRARFATRCPIWTVTAVRSEWRSWNGFSAQ